MKCLAFHLIARIPGGRSLYTTVQRRVTGTHLLEVTDGRIETYRYHLDNYLNGRRGVAYEFGAGSNLLAPLLLSEAGAPKIFAVDLDRLATVEKVNHVIGQLRQRRGGAWPAIENLEDDLTSKYRIVYRAPADARDTGFPAGSIDFTFSTSVLEHIPAGVLPAVLNECGRVASPAGTLSFVIGYVDHYAHSDSRISYFNFYQYSDRRWGIFNPPNHYQNRLRHSDYERLFREQGFTIEEGRRVMSLPQNRLPAVPIHRRFREYSEDDLFAHDGLFRLRPPVRDRSGAERGSASFTGGGALPGQPARQQNVQDKP